MRFARSTHTLSLGKNDAKCFEIPAHFASCNRVIRIRKENKIWRKEKREFARKLARYHFDALNDEFLVRY